MSKLNLTLHCGAATCSREQVGTIRTPDATNTWQPIAHDRFITQVESALAATNMRVVNEAHSLTRDGQRYFGLLQVANCQNTGDHAYVLGLRNSHDKSFPAGLVVGAQVFVCDNLAFTGEIRLSRKHTSRIVEDLPRLTAKAVGELSQKWTRMTERYDRYKQFEISDAAAHDMIVRAMDVKAAPTTQFGEILKEWRTPRHQEFVEAGKTAWRLYNAFTEAAKAGSLSLLPSRTIALQGLFDAQVGFFSGVEAAAARITEGTQDAVVEAAHLN